MSEYPPGGADRQSGGPSGSLASSEPGAAPAPNQPPPTEPTPPPLAGAAWSGPPRAAGPAPGVAFAPYGGRLVAYILDSILIGFVAFVGVVVAAIPVTSSQSGGAILATLTLLFLTFIVSLAYFPFFWVRTGSTPAMRLFRLRVVRDRDGGPITAGTAVLRLIGYWVSSAVFYIGFVWVFFDERRRGWHDLIAGTVVIEDDR